MSKKNIPEIENKNNLHENEERDALRNVFSVFISQEFQELQEIFPDTFYEELFRLNNWNFTVDEIYKKPGIISTWVKVLIYFQLPKNVFDGFNKKNQKNNRKDFDLGIEALNTQINKVIGIMQSSSDWNEFKENFNKTVDTEKGQSEIEFDSIEKQINIHPKNVSQQTGKGLKTILQYNPKKKKG